jgi:hypothetical protein
MIVGFVQDTAGQGLANAAVCATTVFDDAGTPVTLVYESSTNGNGAYTVSIDLVPQSDVHAGLTVAATPAAASGLAPGLKSGLSVLISVKSPPAETTHANVTVAKGTPYNGVFCAYGP